MTSSLVWQYFREPTQTEFVESIEPPKKGQITVSAHARKSLGIGVGDSLMEIVLDGYIVYVPADKVLSELMTNAQTALNKAGISIEQFKGDVGTRKEKNLSKRYPGLTHESAT